MKGRKINMKEKVLIVVLALSIVMLHGTQSYIVNANNYKDTTFDFYDGGTGSDFATSMRSKTDSSASYVNNNGKKTTTISVAVAGSKKYKKYPPAANCDYISEYYDVKKGKRKYISNSMYPKCKYAYLLVATANHTKHTIAGVWSPDNCSGY